MHSLRDCCLFAIIHYTGDSAAFVLSDGEYIEMLLLTGGIFLLQHEFPALIYQQAVDLIVNFGNLP